MPEYLANDFGYIAKRQKEISSELEAAIAAKPKQEPAPAPASAAASDEDVLLGYDYCG